MTSPVINTIPHFYGHGHRPECNLYNAYMAEIKTKPTDVDPVEFIAQLPAKRQPDLMKLLDMMQEITGEPPVMWGPSMIGFGQYKYRYETGHEGVMLRIGFASRSTGPVVYGLGGYEGFEQDMEQLGKVKCGVSCTYFSSLAKVDTAMLRTMLEKSYRVPCFGEVSD